MKQIDYIQDYFKHHTPLDNSFDIDTYEYTTDLFTIIYFPSENVFTLDKGYHGCKDMTFDQVYRLVNLWEELK